MHLSRPQPGRSRCIRQRPCGRGDPGPTCWPGSWRSATSCRCREPSGTVGSGSARRTYVALVITLWQTLEQILYFPFVVFSGITLALFGAGHYTLHHWKLESTSRGLLVIATLLIPLNLLVLAGLSRGREGGLAETATTAAGLALSVAVVASAGRVLAARALWLLALGVAGAAATQLLVPRLPDPPGAWLFALPACLAVSCQATAIGWRLRLLRGAGFQPASSPRQVGNLPLLPGRLETCPTQRGLRSRSWKKLQRPPEEAWRPGRTGAARKSVAASSFGTARGRNDGAIPAPAWLLR